MRSFLLIHGRYDKLDPESSIKIVEDNLTKFSRRVFYERRNINLVWYTGKPLIIKKVL